MSIENSNYEKMDIDEEESTKKKTINQTDNKYTFNQNKYNHNYKFHYSNDPRTNNNTNNVQNYNKYRGGAKSNNKDEGKSFKPQDTRKANPDKLFRKTNNQINANNT